MRHTLASAAVCPRVCPNAVQEPSSGSQRQPIHGNARSRRAPNKTVAFDAKCNHTRALYRRRLTRFGHTAWAHFWAHSGRFSIGFLQKTEEKRDKATVFLTATATDRCLMTFKQGEICGGLEHNNSWPRCLPRFKPAVELEVDAEGDVDNARLGCGVSILLGERRQARPPESARPYARTTATSTGIGVVVRSSVRDTTVT